MVNTFCSNTRSIMLTLTLQENVQIATLHLRPLPYNCLKCTFATLVATVWSKCRRCFLLNKLKGALIISFTLSTQNFIPRSHFPQNPQISNSLTTLTTNSVAPHPFTLAPHHQLTLASSSSLWLSHSQPSFRFRFVASHKP
jgi:hypothetical protein